ncbi:MAG: hypothetical protein AAGA75_08330 [Cyanobacteria bacterium P01_E01_bin.6]
MALTKQPACLGKQLVGNCHVRTSLQPPFNPEPLIPNFGVRPGNGTQARSWRDRVALQDGGSQAPGWSNGTAVFAPLFDSLAEQPKVSAGVGVFRDGVYR